MPARNGNTLIERWDQAHPRWAELMALPDVEDLHIEDKAEEWHLGIYTLVALVEDAIAGVLRFWTQQIGFDEDKPLFIVDGEQAIEAKIVTFHVLPTFRLRGIGRDLQVAAMVWARELGCYQVRSRSSYGHRENHALKASLGFGISPVGTGQTDRRTPRASWFRSVSRQISWGSRPNDAIDRKRSGTGWQSGESRSRSACATGSSDSSRSGLSLLV